MTMTSNPSHHIKQTLRQQHECIGKRCTICKDLENGQMVFVLSFYPMFHFLRVSSVTIKYKKQKLCHCKWSSGRQNAPDLTKKLWPLQDPDPDGAHAGFTFCFNRVISCFTFRMRNFCECLTFPVGPVWKQEAGGALTKANNLKLQNP